MKSLLLMALALLPASKTLAQTNAQVSTTSAVTASLLPSHSKCSSRTNGVTPISL